jgi:hypothetical protein
MTWSEVLAATRDLASRLGGCAIVSSHELLNAAARRGFPHADHAVYAGFWGVDRSGQNPLFRWLTATGQAAPFEAIACDSWEEALALPGERLRVLAGEIASAGAATGDGMRP